MNTIIIENNNPNCLPGILFMLAIFFIIYSLISAKIKKNRKLRLEEAKKKIEKRHEQLEMEERLRS